MNEAGYPGAAARTWNPWGPGPGVGAGPHGAGGRSRQGPRSLGGRASRGGYLARRMDDPLTRAREFLDRRTAITILASIDRQGAPEMCILIAPGFTPEGHVAGGEEDQVSGNTFRNLRVNGRARLLVLDPIMDPRARDGVRLDVEFLGAEEDGPGLAHIRRWLEAFAPGRKVVRRLLFKVIEAAPFRVWPGERPVLLG